MPLRKFRRKTQLRTEEPRIRQKSIWGLIETRHRAKVNSALPRLAAKPPGLVVLLNGSHMSPQPGHIPPAHTPPASLPSQRGWHGVWIHAWLVGLSHPQAPP